MKKVLKIVVNVLAWVILILAFLVTIMVFTSTNNGGVPNILGIMPMTVQSQSMEPTFKKGDMILVKQVDLYDLKVDDVITFNTVIQGQRVQNTHRIVEVIEDGGSKSFVTKGDNNPVNDESVVYASDIVGRWTGTKIGGLGKALDFLRTKTGFFVCIVIPMAIFFLFELYKFIMVLIESKKANAPEIDEEEIKRKAIEEYLAKEKAAKEASEGTEQAAETAETAASEEETK